MTTRQSTPSSAEQYASACAWLPAEMPITPRPRSSAESEASFVRTPRGLNEPVRWKSSAFRKTRSPSVADEKTGVRCRRPAIASRARTTSSRERSTATESLCGLARKLGEHLFGLGLRLVEAAEVAHARHEQHGGGREQRERDRDPEGRRDADRVRHGPGENEAAERAGAPAGRDQSPCRRAAERLLRDHRTER